MKWFRKILTVVGYVGVGGAPILASTGVGMPVAAVLGGIGVLAGGILHFLDSPRTPADVIEMGRQAKALADAVQAAKKAP